MSSIIKSISLCPKTAGIAKSIPNFSRFVRECLFRYYALEHGAECPVEKMEGTLIFGVCVPGASRICMKHWPDGRPMMKDWRKFREMNERMDPREKYKLSTPEGNKTPREWIAWKAELANPRMIDFANLVVEGNRKPEKKRKPRSFLGKILNFLRL